MQEKLEESLQPEPCSLTLWGWINILWMNRIFPVQYLKRASEVRLQLFFCGNNNLLKFLLKWFCFAAHDWQLLTRAAVLIQSNVMFHPHVLRHLSIPAETSFVCRALRTAIVAMLLMDGIISLDLKHKPVMFFHLNSFYNSLHAENNWLCGTNSLDKQNKISCRVIVN